MKKISASLGLAAIVLTFGAVACETTVETSPSVSTSAKPSDSNERRDVVSYKLVDRSEFGLDDFWITYTIKNNSSKPSTYIISYEIMLGDTRVCNGDTYESRIQPDQTAKGEDLPTCNLKAGEPYKLNLLQVERNAS